MKLFDLNPMDRLKKGDFMIEPPTNRSRTFWILIFFIFLAPGCGTNPPPAGIVATTSLAADLVASLMPPEVHVESLMGPGVDPHTFEARSGSIRQLHSAGLVVHHGLHLEGRLSELLDGLQKRAPEKVHSLASPLLRDHSASLRKQGGEIDPHVWFSPRLWRATVPDLARALAASFPAHAEAIARKEKILIQSISDLDLELRDSLSVIPKESRVLVTSHDAFGYWGAEYDFEVHPIQGISTATEVAESSLRELADLIGKRKIPAGFVESSVSPRTIEKLQQMIGGRHFQLGGELFSDSLGQPGTAEGTYAGMLRHNAKIMIAALGKPRQ